MGIDVEFHQAFYKAQMGAGNALPQSGTVFVSVKDDDKEAAIDVARSLVEVGMTIIATKGTSVALTAAGVPNNTVKKVIEGRPHIVDRIINGDVQMVVNTTIGRQSILDSHSIRHETVRARIPYFTTMAAARIAAKAMSARQRAGSLTVTSLQPSSNTLERWRRPPSSMRSRLLVRRAI